MSPLLRLGARILRTADKRPLWKFAWNFGIKGMLSVERFKRQLRLADAVRRRQGSVERLEFPHALRD